MSIQQNIKDTLSVAAIASFTGGFGAVLEISKRSYESVKTYYDIVLKYPKLANRPIEAVTKYNVEMLQTRMMARHTFITHVAIYFLAAVTSLLAKKVILHFSEKNENKANIAGILSFSAITLSLTKPIIAIQALVSGVIYSYLDSTLDPYSDSKILNASTAFGISATIGSACNLLQFIKIDHMAKQIAIRDAASHFI